MNSVKLDALKRAIEFLDQCRADPTAKEVGALRDAVQGVEMAARDVLADDAITQHYTDRFKSGLAAMYRGG